MQRILVTAIALVVLIGGGTYYYTSQQSAPGSSEVVVGSSTSEATAVSDTETAIDTSGIMEMALGSEDAPITIIEYASFTCPHCARFHSDVFPQLQADYIDAGHVRFIYREVYFDQFGLWAGMVARCNGGLRYFGLADLIYEQQREWLADGDPATVVENLRGIGRTAGMNDEILDACLQDGENAQALVAQYQQNAEEHGINSTPSFVIDGVTMSNMGYDEFSALLDEKLAE